MKPSWFHSHQTRFAEMIPKEIGVANPTMEVTLCNQAVHELYMLENDMIFHANQKLGVRNKTLGLLSNAVLGVFRDAVG